jgi:plastocyanin
MTGPSRRIVLIVVVVLGLVALAGAGIAILKSRDSDPAPVATADTTPVADSDKPVPINMQDFAFDPVTRTVKVGTVIQVTNLDDAKHTFTSGVRDKPDGVFNQTVDSGVTVMVPFATVGTQPFYCNIHPGMKGSVEVTP